MKKQIMRAAGYATAPKLMLALNNPKKAALAKATAWTGKHVLRRRKRTSAGMTAAKGLGAAALAVPVGVWLGRRVWGRGETR